MVLGKSLTGGADQRGLGGLGFVLRQSWKGFLGENDANSS